MKKIYKFKEFKIIVTLISINILLFLIASKIGSLGYKDFSQGLLNLMFILVAYSAYQGHILIAKSQKEMADELLNEPNTEQHTNKNSKL